MTYVTCPKQIIFNLNIIFYSNAQYGHCNRYPYVDDRQGKFLGRSYLRVGDIITGNEPNEKELEVIDYLSAVNKIKMIVKKKKYNVKELRDKYKCLDQVIVSKLIFVKVVLEIGFKTSRWKMRH